MAVVVEHYVVRLEVPVDNVALVQVLEGQEDLGDVESGPVLGEASLVGNYFAEITAGAEVEDEEELGLGLERVVKVHDERVPHVREHVPLCLGVADQVLPQDSPLAQRLHRVQLSRILVSHQVHVSKAATAELAQGQEVVLPVRAPIIRVLHRVNILNLGNAGRIVPFAKIILRLGKRGISLSISNDLRHPLDLLGCPLLLLLLVGDADLVHFLGRSLGRLGGCAVVDGGSTVVVGVGSRVPQDLDLGDFGVEGL
mmetsp:Transcript_9075/g.15324  ORF Transcript_9075/g.15324 Transcript_9075/m.15324 type:complete len:255 (-) Transcript_9075:287-1051(-)